MIFYVRNPEKEQQIKFKKIIIIYEEIENRISKEKNLKPQSLSQKRSIKLKSLYENNRERTQISNIRNERGDITINLMYIKG